MYEGPSDRADTGADPDGRADLAERRQPLDALADEQDLVGREPATGRELAESREAQTDPWMLEQTRQRHRADRAVRCEVAEPLHHLLVVGKGVLGQGAAWTVRRQPARGGLSQGPLNVTHAPRATARATLLSRFGGALTPLGSAAIKLRSCVSVE
ncbi:hypothetical protein [Streptomyces alboflavus]|uniref:hypothetical protein n=1 Tax=Streptomyces alboflavus TaxID=67267 RepID=UPI0013319842|nr:hypothetical protein [Streptomyces alboflavus]